MTTCSFCGKEIEKGTGKQIIKKDGKTLNLHAKKCEKNMLNLKRKARKLKWTTHYKK